MIPRKENITRVEVQGENFCPVKSRRDSLLGQRISSLPALYTSDGRKFTGGAPEPAEGKEQGQSHPRTTLFSFLEKAFKAKVGK